MPPPPPDWATLPEAERADALRAVDLALRCLWQLSEFVPTVCVACLNLQEDVERLMREYGVARVPDARVKQYIDGHALFARISQMGDAQLVREMLLNT
jgi:hypothetical protein